MDADRWKERGCLENVKASDLEGAHIIPYAYGSWRWTQGPPRSVVDVWTVLYQCFPEVRRAGMNVENIYHPSNGMMLLPDLHKQFGKFLMAFEATDVRHKYKLKLYRRFRSYARNALPEDGTVTFRKAGGAENIPLPNPVLLDCHFRVAEILNASGMNEFIDRKIREWEDLKDGPDAAQLRPDGSTDVARYLRAGLWDSVAV
ncbi:HNH endonuclease signature motif containing protein [Aspergillus thermomutatus]|uniref:HNH nuclease domain-containing protein n=1 Tax=Aspergillus thermomutatus TaxID=41047 RepID=A0A397HXK1_ASPTH|nr:uncharacterized protein CDV56_107354 [Aspergillus thermomutatus]RHZ67507.1 hypothetical protein CDV56_107354 [Aspergillus thermomutatus]